MKKLSIVGKDYSVRKMSRVLHTGDRMKYWVSSEPRGVGFWGLLFGAAFLCYSGDRTKVLIAGPLVAWKFGRPRRRQVVVAD